MALVKTIIDGNKIEYDNSEFEVRYSYLHYIGNGVHVTNPKGNISCYKMFENFKGTSLDLSNFDTSNVTDMSFMFFNCQNLKSLNLSSFNTNKVTDMGFMFYECINLKTLDISKFNTENVIDMSYMFMDCKNLKELDISSFYIGNVKILNDIFFDCKSLETLKVSSDCLQFFSDYKKFLFGNCGNVNIVPVSKLDKIVEDLFY